ncbi:hypothetical protein J2T61_000241 [Methanocalculus sp. AMF5]|nr:hypothetical protein [Methanocalculus sp. AMF5]
MTILVINIYENIDEKINFKLQQLKDKLEIKRRPEQVMSGWRREGEESRYRYIYCIRK